MLGISEKCKLNQFVAKKTFYDNADMTASDKKLFKENISKITLTYQLHTKNTNISAYMTPEREYPLINVFEVALDKNEKVKRIAEIIMRSIPYPMVLVFLYEEQYQVWTAHQRVNQNDDTKNVLEDFVFTDWVQDLDFIDVSAMNMSNFFAVYSGIVDAISIHNAKSVVKTENLTGKQARELTGKLEEIENQITALKARMKKETQFNKRIELNMEIKKLEQKKEEIVEG